MNQAVNLTRKKSEPSSQESPLHKYYSCQLGDLGANKLRNLCLNAQVYLFISQSYILITALIKAKICFVWYLLLLHIFDSLLT